MLIANNLNLSIENWFEINNLITKKLYIFFWNNTFIVSNGLLKLKKWNSYLIGMLKIWRLMLNFISNYLQWLNVLWNEIIKSYLNFFLILIFIIIINFWRVKIWVFFISLLEMHFLIFNFFLSKRWKHTRMDKNGQLKVHLKVQIQCIFQ